MKAKLILATIAFAALAITQSPAQALLNKLKQKAEANVHLSGKTIFVECDDTNLYVAIDSLTEKLDRQILKHKEKLSGHRHEEPSKHIEPE